ncbi:MAG: hypothetical protein VBE63_08200 [Lamprobacter sp.]|uniref:hypothetical protein n=1 Tax=Lamprobacter sp. TaxID=3100796 RepID=UPI002B25FF66|nr:hypothetical protein [Lamprobacter sp.]MEA3639910.1 hypothetical protein [Lamprobacter sp.]
MKLAHFFVERLDERSTWRALVAFLTLIGIGLSPEQKDGIIAAGVAIGAALEALLPDPAGRIHNRVSEQSDTSELPSAADAKPRSASHSDAFGPWHSGN